MKAVINFAILGCGMISNIHADALKSLPEARLMGVADASPEKAAVFAQKRGVKAYADYNAMLDDPDIDVVCICTPSGFHEVNAISALRAGKNVVLEKPMALTTAGADRIIETCKNSGRLLTVVSQLRFSSDIQRAKTLIEQKAFGNPILYGLYMKYWRDADYYSGSKWRGTYRFDGGGALMNQGIHGVDLLRYLIGDFSVIKGKCATLHHNIEVEDTAVALIRCENGALGVIEATTAAYPGFERRIEINGDRGCATIRENRIERLIIGETVSEASSREPEVNTSNDPSAMSFEPHASQLANMIDAIKGRARLVSDANEGRKAVKIIEDIYISNNE